MLTITPALRKHMTEKFQVKADASDDDVRKSVSEQVLAGKITPAELVELTKAPAQSEAETKVQGMIDSSLAKALGPMTELLTKALGQTGTAGAGKPDGQTAGGAPVENKGGGTQVQSGQQNPAEKALALAGTYGGDDQVRVRVKNAVEQFSDTRTTLTWDKSSLPRLQKALAGMPVTSHFDGLPYTLDDVRQSDRMKAIAGVWFKHMGLRRMRAKGQSVPGHIALKEYEKDILQYIVHECKFVGGDESQFGGYEYEGTKLKDDLHRKAVLDDSTSGGLEAVPIEFDAAVILTPLLNGELFPFVSIANVTRRRIEATKISNPTMQWGTAEGTAISLFNTDSFISAFDNSIYPITGAIELGLDFLADSPLAVAGIVIDRYGLRFRQEMDNVIATGNGTNQPEGLFTASGVATVTPAGGAGGAQTVGDYESLRFGVAKEFREEAGNRAMYVATDTSYARARGIPVDSSNDQRRVFGIDNQEDYRLFNRRYAVNGSLTNAQIGYFCMNRYRMYRRQGLEVRLVTEDWTLARQNKEGLIVRARFGGALELAAAGAKITNGQS